MIERSLFLATLLLLQACVVRTGPAASTPPPAYAAPASAPPATAPPAPAPAPAPTEPAPTASTFGIGAHVSVYWKGAWYPATVLKISATGYFIHYDGYADSWDEWVGPNRIK